MNRIRAFIFNIFFYGGSAFWSIALFWALALPNKTCLAIIYNTYISYTNFIEKWIMGITLKIEGMENLPKDGKFIIAAKHQSAFETLNIPFMKKFKYPAIVLKKELVYIPIWGLYTIGTGQVAIDRSSGTVAMRSIVKGSKKAMEEGRPVIIFPQGTRTAIGAKKPYLVGIAKIYKELNVPVVPLALNSGLVWPKNSFMKYPGVVTYKFLKPIQPGLKPSELMEKLETTIETETDKLIEKEQKIKNEKK